MKENKYAKQWLDPRWQKRRLEIMQRDEFRCKECLAEDKTLNVHHIYYTSGASVWEYPDHALVTLCNDCHETEHQVAGESERDLIDAYKQIGFLSSQIGGFAFTIDHLHRNIGQEKTKKLLEMMDFILFRPVCDESSFGEIETLYEKLKPKGHFAKKGEE